MNRSRAPFSTLPALVCLLISLLANKVAAQEVNVPATRNPHIRKLARLYEELEYEAALKLIPKAEQYAGNTAQEKLWLELMKGILHYSLRNAQKSDEAFRRALQQSPYTSLPLLTPSQTLYEHFNALRRQSAPAPAAQAAPGSHQPPGPPATSQRQPDGISEAALQEKLAALEKQGREWPGGAMPPKLASSLESLRQQARQARTAQERKTIAATIDLWTDLLAHQAAKHTPSLGPHGALTTATPAPEKRPLEPGAPSQAVQGKPPAAKPIAVPAVAASAAPSPATLTAATASASKPPSSIARDVLWKRLSDNEARLRQQNVSATAPATLHLKEIRQQLLSAFTSHQRMNVAVELDRWERRALSNP